MRGRARADGGEHEVVECVGSIKRGISWEGEEEKKKGRDGMKGEGQSRINR